PRAPAPTTRRGHHLASHDPSHDAARAARARARGLLRDEHRRSRNPGRRRRHAPRRRPHRRGPARPGGSAQRDGRGERGRPRRRVADPRAARDRDRHAGQRGHRDRREPHPRARHARHARPDPGRARGRRPRRGARHVLGRRRGRRPPPRDPQPATARPLVTSSGPELAAEATLDLAPTVILTDTSLGPWDVVLQMRDAGIPVVVLDPKRDLSTVPTLVTDVAHALGVPEEGALLAERTDAAVQAKLAEIAAVAPQDPAEKLRIAFLYVRGQSGVYYMFGDGSGVEAL